MNETILLVPDEAAMRELGQDLLRSLNVGDVVLLSGELGAGKTTIVRGALESIGYPGPVRSPTFSLIQLYATEPPVLHADLYRVNSLKGLDLIELLDRNISFVEWPERASELSEMPGTIKVQIEFSEAGRTVKITR